MLSLAKEKVNDMNILLFGVTNVGKTTTGQIMADILEIEFYDVDEEIKKKYNTTLEEFVKTGTLEERDENDVIYRDDEYKNARKSHYMREIAEDLIWYGNVYKNIKNKYDINNGEPDIVAKALIEDFNLKQLCE